MNNSLNRSRRRFLEFLGKAGIAAPVLKSSSLLAGLMANRYAQANEGSVKRVVFVYFPLGSPDTYWLPTSAGLNGATQAYDGWQDVCHFMETHVVSGGPGLIWKSLQELRWTPDWTSDTIDQQIARVLGQTSPFASLHFGVQTLFDIGFESISRKNLMLVPPMENLLGTYQYLFGGSTGQPPAHFHANQRKANVLDAHMAAIQCASNRLSAGELETLEKYENALTGLKERINTAAVNPEMCVAPTWNEPGYDTTVSTFENPGNFAEQAYLQAELITHAMACGLTNVATLQLGDGQGQFKAHDLGFDVDLHSSSHVAPPMVYNVDFVNYLSRCVVYLIKNLAETDDPAVPGTKLLDNTVLLQVTSEGDGTNHTADFGPHVIATRMPAFKTGLATPQNLGVGNNLKILQTLAVGLGLEQYIGKDSQHCIWPCGGDIDRAKELILT